DTPALGLLGDGRTRPGGGVHSGVGDGDRRGGVEVDGVDPPAGEDDDVGGEVHRRDPMLDEDLEAVAAVAEHDDADGGSDRNRLGVGDTAAPAGAVGQVRTIAALGVDVSDHA